MSHDTLTLDVFEAIAEPRRREIIGLLAGRQATPVNDLVDSLRLPQPAVSKHLGVLRRAGLVTVQKDGQRRLYALNAAGLKPVHDWIRTYERYWSGQLDRIKARAERLAAQKRAGESEESTSQKTDPGEK
jgi:DNA-binding transcriptional ArsR family regulator